MMLGDYASSESVQMMTHLTFPVNCNIKEMSNNSFIWVSNYHKWATACIKCTLQEEAGSLVDTGSGSDSHGCCCCCWYCKSAQNLLLQHIGMLCHISRQM